MPRHLTCAHSALESYVTAILGGLGTPRDIAAEVSRHLVRANLSGHDSQGVARLPEYVRLVDQGSIIATARPSLVRETENAALIDGGQGFGHFAAAAAMDWAIGRARSRGVAMAALGRASHMGRLGEYTERASTQGLIGLVTTGAAGPRVGAMPLYGGQTPFLATNPWSIAVPGSARALVYDAATSTVAGGRVLVARASGAELPPESLRDRDGRPTADPEVFWAGGMLWPLGGPAVGYKGSGLALAAALLGGLAMLGTSDSHTDGWIGGVFLLVIDPRCFGDAERYRALVDATLEAAAAAPPEPGCEGVLVPGERGRRTRAVRSEAGIPLPETTWAELSRLADRFGVAIPATGSPSD